ncbi:glycerophosphodiester phosphodiesterase family protein [Methylobacterium mesophilicum]|uniref:glycerophosphodiester phosphodiesterase family protein n=1 Tax=Methylobacterium mesophilicum TaxID=39956 RepID=UPI002F35408E
MKEILNTSSTSDTLVLAHRGYWGKYVSTSGGTSKVPENSTGSLYLANSACFDGVELDVKMTSDAVPILMHDFNLGRTTNVYIYGQNKYNPSNNTGHNPAVSKLPWKGLIESLRLLYPDRSDVSAFYVPSVSEIFNTHKNSGYTVPMIFDTKDAASVKAINDLAAKTYAQPGTVVAVKVNATLYTSPDSFSKDAPKITAIPVFTTNMLGKINVPSVRADWQKSVKTIEINVKEKDGLLQGQLDNAKSAGQRIGVFQAIPDGPGTGQFYRNYGACCYTLSDLYYNGKDLASGKTVKDTADKRGDIAYLMDQGYGLITTDDPRTVVATLSTNSRRKSHTGSVANMDESTIPADAKVNSTTADSSQKASKDDTTDTDPDIYDQE